MKTYSGPSLECDGAHKRLAKTAWAASLHSGLLRKSSVDVIIIHVAEKVIVLGDVVVDIQGHESERGGEVLERRHRQVAMKLVVLRLYWPLNVGTEALEARLLNHGESGGEMDFGDACNIVRNGSRNPLRVFDKLRGNVGSLSDSGPRFTNELSHVGALVLDLVETFVVVVARLNSRGKDIMLSYHPTKRSDDTLECSL